MTASVITWVACAVIVFWGVGAYNRLMRLRAEANTAFGALEAEFARQIELVRNQLPGPEPTQPAPLEGGTGSIWSPLHAAAGQLAACLSAAKSKPLDADRIAALGASQGVLATAWQRAEREDAHDLAGPRLPETLTARRAQLAIQSQAAAHAFNQAVSRYNDAISQFPALLLAWLFGFKRARALEHAPVTAVAA